MLSSSTLAFLAVFVITASAQTSPSPPTTAQTSPLPPSNQPTPADEHGLTKCILNCFQPAADAYLCNYTDLRCICNSPQLQATALGCVKEKCMPNELTIATEYGVSHCDHFNTNTMGQDPDSDSTGSVDKPPSGASGASKGAPSPVAVGKSASASATTDDRQDATAHSTSSTSGARAVLIVNTWWCAAAFTLSAALAI